MAISSSSTATFSLAFPTFADLSAARRFRHHINHLHLSSRTSTGRRSLSVRAAAKLPLPSGVEVPKVEPKLNPAFLGFTRTAEIWNSRACMIGLIGTFIVELILNKGILEIIGVDVGKGLNLPL